MPQLNFGLSLRAAREKSGKRLKDLAVELGVSSAYLSDIERGRRNPPGEDKLIRIAGILKLDVEEVFQWAEGKSSTSCLEGGTPCARAFAAKLASQWGSLSDATIRRMLNILETQGV